MKLSDYFVDDNGAVSFDAEQASAFAKGVAGDFNPLHDPDNKRFCVPGDLLFCVLINRYGLAQTTNVQFSGMLDDKTRMHLPASVDEQVHIVDDRNKQLLILHLNGFRINDYAFNQTLSALYVKFSGKTFPDILVPLMRSANVMINPERPLVIYKDMSIELNAQAAAAIDSGSVELDLAIDDTDISINGRKAAVRLRFLITSAGRTLGEGEKNMVLGGLREYDESAMQNIIDLYSKWRESYLERELSA
ncbi:MAG: DUF3581 domain-containing protein [Granulosicoccus sp.]|nr:DUF3581 domain-containing protein [Granulosicoccus sp.]